MGGPFGMARDRTFAGKIGTGQTFTGGKSSMRKSRHKTPPNSRTRRRKRRNSIGTPSSEKRRVGGRRRSNSISSPAELKEVKKNKSSFINSSDNSFKNSRFGNTGARYIRKVKKERNRKKLVKKKKDAVRRKANEKANKIMHYMAEYGHRCSKRERDIIKKIHLRMGRYVESEIVRSRFRREDRAATTIKNWYFKMVKPRRIFKEHWESVKEERIQQFREEKRRMAEIKSSQMRQSDPTRNFMTPESRVIRMKWSHAPSPSSEKKEESPSDYIGDELDDLDEEYNIDPVESTRKERESKNVSITGVGVRDLETTISKDIVNFIGAMEGDEEEDYDEEEENEGEEEDNEESVINYAELVHGEQSPAIIRKRKEVMDEIVRSLQNSAQKETDVDDTLEIPPFKPILSKRERESVDVVVITGEAGDDDVDATEGKEGGGYADMFEEEHEEGVGTSSYVMTEMSPDKFQSPVNQTKDESALYRTPLLTKPKSQNQISQTPILQMKDESKSTIDLSTSILETNRSVEPNAQRKSSEKSVVSEQTLQIPYFTPKRRSQFTSPSRGNVSVSKKIVKKVFLNKSAVGGKKKKKKTLITRKTTVTTQQTRECCTIL